MSLEKVLNADYDIVGSLKPLPWWKPAKEKNIVAWDSEDNGAGEPWLFNFYDGMKHYTFDLRYGEHSISDVREFIYEYPIKKSLFVAHNSAYDLGNLFVDNDYSLLDKMIFCNKFISAKFKDLGHTFIDSFNFHSVSLKVLGKIVGDEKMDFDFNIDYENPEEVEALKNSNTLVPYCKQDCVVVYKFVDMLQKMCVNKFKINLPVTVGGIAMGAFKRKYIHEPIPTFNHPDCIRSYYGGRVELFYKGKVNGDVTVSDVNSMYPTVMCNEFPDPGSMESSTIDTHKFGIGKFSVWVPEDTKVPPLPYRSKEGRLFFPVGTFKGYWTYDEVRNAVKHGAVILKEYSGGWGTNKSIKPFEKYIMDIYALRLKAKADGDEFGVLFYKMLMNNLYGKFCQHTDREELTPENIPDTILNKMKGRLKSHNFGLYQYIYDFEEPPANACYIWGTYVTSYARIMLHELLVETDKAGHTLLYCDTDSIMFKKRNENIPFVIGNELGQLDEEHFDRANFYMPKGYIIERDTRVVGACNPYGGGKYIEGVKKVACKGVSTENAFDYFNRKPVKKRQPVKFKESLVRNIDKNIWREVEKINRTVYRKRTGRYGSTKAVKAENIPEIELEIKKQVKTTF